MIKVWKRFVGKVQDLIYNLNDIVIACLIVISASFIIYWRIQVVMDYPKYLEEKAKKNLAANPDFTDVDLTQGEFLEGFNYNPEEFEAAEGTESTVSSAASQDSSKITAQSGGKDVMSVSTNENTENFTVKNDTKFTIPAGSSGEKIAELLLQNGLIASKKDFLNMLVEKKADTKLKAGTFNIPAGSGLADIIKIITK